MSFAQMEAAAVLAVLLPSVHLRLRPGYIPVPKLRVTLRPAHGMPMRLITGSPREDAGEVLETPNRARF